MHFLGLLSLLLGCLSYYFVSATDNGKTTEVTWDKYSLSVKGQRVYVFSGEFHYQRLPVPELWLDVFQKLRANGFNAVSSTRFRIYKCPEMQSLTISQYTFSGASILPRKALLTLKMARMMSSESLTMPNKPVST